MATVLDDVTNGDIDAGYIQRRVDDWADRVDGLFHQLAEALPDGWSPAPSHTVPMHEELMRKYDVPPKSMPTFPLRHQSGAVAELVPRSLWIIGANGRLDLTYEGRRYIVFDTSDSFAPPDWHVCPAQDRREREPFTPDWLRQVLQ